MLDLDGNSSHPVSVVGYKLVQDSYRSRDEVEWEAERQAKLEETRGEKAEKDLKKQNKAKEQAYKKQQKELEQRYKLRVIEYKKNSKTGPSGVEGNVVPTQNMPDTNNIDNIPSK